MMDDLCRLTVCGPARTVELAVPVHVPLIDLLPALVGHLGDGLADAGLEHGGWVLQRLGDPPLREELSVAALGLRDGDVVHLRPRAEQLPPLDFDDLIDGVATTISARPDRWRPEMSRRLLIGLLAVPLAAGLVVLAGHLGPLSELAAAALAIVLIGLTAAASRALADLPAAGVLGAAAIGYAGLAAAELPLLPYGEAAVRPLAWVTIRAAMPAVGAVVAGAAMAVAMARGGRPPALVATAVAGMFVAVGGALATVARLDAAATAGILLALIMPLGGWMPMLAFRLARMRLDPTPSTPDELQADLDPVPGQHVLDSTRLADRYMTALYSGLAVIVTGLPDRARPRGRVARARGGDRRHRAAAAALPGARRGPAPAGRDRPGRLRRRRARHGRRAACRRPLLARGARRAGRRGRSCCWPASVRCQATSCCRTGAGPVTCCTR